MVKQKNCSQEKNKETLLTCHFQDFFFWTILIAVDTPGKQVLEVGS